MIKREGRVQCDTFLEVELREITVQQLLLGPTGVYVVQGQRAMKGLYICNFLNDLADTYSEQTAWLQ